MSRYKDPLPEFKVTNKDFPNVSVLEDVVLKKASDKEYEIAKLFSDLRLPNFPQVYRREGEIFAMEKLEGSYQDLTDNGEEELPLDEFLSFFLQVFMALQTIDAHGKFHGDLHSRNILYKTLVNPESEYLTYEFDGVTYRVKHFNRVWVITDFEYVADKWSVLDYPERHFRCMFQARYKGQPIEGSWMYDLYTITKSTIGSTCKWAERLFEMMEEKSSDRPIDAISRVIKNDLSHIYH